ncbi:MAG TPA: CHASE domain-containing protein [Rubrobacteraceae bacterium]|nr:CHASE domain-containing protein [Rubrobacteraceae bacterium]
MKTLLAIPGRVIRNLRRGAAAYTVLIVALLLTALAWFYVREDVQAQNAVRFDETVNATQESINRRTDAYVDAMFGARGLFFASESVNSEEWKGYVNGIKPESRFQGLQALGYAEYVTPEERASYFRRARENGQPGLRPDLDPGGEREGYYPVAFVEPLDDANRDLINRDEYTESQHRAAMDRARDTGEPVATSRVYVMTETAPGAVADLSMRPGFVVYMPVYQKGEPVGTTGERRRALKGFVFGAFRMDGLLKSTFGGSFDPTLDFEVYDGAKTNESSLLYDDDGVRRAGMAREATKYQRSSRIKVAGREWTLFFSALPGFEQGADGGRFPAFLRPLVENVGGTLPLFVLLSGLATSFLLFSIIWMLVRSRDRAERVSEELEHANRELEGANHELEAFSYSVSHDLRAPLRTIDGFSRILIEDYGDRLDAEGEDYLERVRGASQHMGSLIDDLLDLSRVTRKPLRREAVDLSALATDIMERLKDSEPDRKVEVVVERGLIAQADANLLSVALENLLGNAWKFTSKTPDARIEFRADRQPGPGFLAPVYYVRDNGAGFEMAYAQRLFGAFQRLHGTEEFEGTGIGLATVQRIVHRHGGRVWAEGAVGEGATFYFTLGGARGGSGSGAEAPAKKAEVA